MVILPCDKYILKTWLDLLQCEIWTHKYVEETPNLYNVNKTPDKASRL